MENRISFFLTEEEKSKIDEAFATIWDILRPKVVNLSPDDIREMLHMGNKHMSFVIKAGEIAKKNQHLVPDFIDMEAFQVDLNATSNLRDLHRSLESLSNSVSDTLALSGSEALQAALAFYGYLKVAEKSNVEGAETAHRELSQFFPGRGKKSTDEEQMEG